MVSGPGKWGVDSKQYVKRLRASQPQETPRTQFPANALHDPNVQLEQTGVRWHPADLDGIEQSTSQRVRARFRASLPDLIWNAAKLEGNTYTLPEVRTLLEGVTVGGKPTHDEQQIRSLSEAYETLDEMVADGNFALSKGTSDRLHAIVARHEALDAGMFRGEGDATGGGTVNLSNGGVIAGVDHGEGGVLLRERHHRLVSYVGELHDPREQSLVYFAAAARSQFYFDGNKRTARLMTAGVLMSHGYDAIGVPYARRVEFNHALDRLFETDDASELVQFLASCAPR